MRKRVNINTKIGIIEDAIAAIMIQRYPLSIRASAAQKAHIMNTTDMKIVKRPNNNLIGKLVMKSSSAYRDTDWALIEEIKEFDFKVEDGPLSIGDVQARRKGFPF
ncbi:hypothetical protein TSUD_277270 [Trifolium subterraneum]|uniref:Uncharacterized protein n=1 Tax=Trifolium subterraneum TaxID=3900 RepID=A0A2Z6NJK4_TRISU|nr:hypothetical protein TSUD_277270 [Trifolium subterraneum]